MIIKLLTLQINIKFLCIFRKLGTSDIKQMKKITTKEVKQKYFLDFISNNEKLKSGRKNYHLYYDRIINNIKLSKLYKKSK